MGEPYTKENKRDEVRSGVAFSGVRKKEKERRYRETSKAWNRDGVGRRWRGEGV